MLDPLSPTLGTASPLRGLRQYELSKAGLREAIALNPNYWQGYEGLGQTYEATGELEEAIGAFERAVALAGNTARAKAGLARVLALSGRLQEAQQMIQQLRSHAVESDNYHPLVAVALAAVGDEEGALQWLETAYRQRHPGLVEIYMDGRFDDLRADPRFQELQRRIGFQR